MADDNELINQDDIEALLKSAPSQPADDSAADSEPSDSAPNSGDDVPIDQSEIEKLLGGGGSPPPAQAAPPPAMDDADKLLGQDDIEKLLNQSGVGASAAAPTPSSPTSSSPTSSSPAPSQTAGGESDSAISQGDVELLLNQAEQALQSVTAEQKELPATASSFQFTEFSGSPANTESATLDLISDVELNLKIELGRTNMYLEDVLKLRKGAVVPLDKLAGDPVDIFVNGRLVARGEVLVLNDNFCVRVAELVASKTPAA